MTYTPALEPDGYRFTHPVFGQRILHNQLLGRGGMGEVYRIEENGTPYALKVTQPQFLARNEQFYQALAIAEARITRAAHSISDCFPEISDVAYVKDSSQGHPVTNVAIKMEYIAGENLDNRTITTPSLEISDILKAFYDSLVGQRLLAQELGIINADYKPSNIMYTSSNTAGLGRGRVIDLGIAKLLHSSRLRPSIPDLALKALDSHSYGTIEYSSPKELAQQEEPGEPILQFKAGLVGYELITDQLFYDALAQEHGGKFSQLPFLDKAKALFYIGNDFVGINKVMNAAAEQYIQQNALSAHAAQALRDQFSVLTQALHPDPVKRPGLLVIENTTLTTLHAFLQMPYQSSQPEHIQKENTPTLSLNSADLTLPPTQPLDDLVATIPLTSEQMTFLN
ncbi:hypothetical protein HYV86_03245 [Candidatus Woesearchaeota archaeon]|nr:hypothetical protein [Candidatus Woesearchaeota archaeon]